MKNLNPENTFVAHCNESLERINLNDLEILRQAQDDKLDNSNDVSLRLSKTFSQYTFLIGPEGDFSDKEIQLLADKGIKAVSLGNQRLRTETAGIFVSAWNYDKMF